MRSLKLKRILAKYVFTGLIEEKIALLLKLFELLAIYYGAWFLALWFFSKLYNNDENCVKCLQCQQKRHSKFLECEHCGSEKICIEVDKTGPLSHAVSMTTMYTWLAIKIFDNHDAIKVLIFSVFIVIPLVIYMLLVAFRTNLQLLPDLLVWQGLINKHEIKWRDVRKIKGASSSIQFTLGSKKEWKYRIGLHQLPITNLDDNSLNNLLQTYLQNHGAPIETSEKPA